MLQLEAAWQRTIGQTEVHVTAAPARPGPHLHMACEDTRVARTSSPTRLKKHELYFLVRPGTRQAQRPGVEIPRSAAQHATEVARERIRKPTLIGNGCCAPVSALSGKLDAVFGGYCGWADFRVAVRR